MSLIRNILLTLLVFVISACSNYNLQNNRSLSSIPIENCSKIVSSFNKSYIKIEQDKFMLHYNALNETLSGNLATVFRSEWKAKENYVDGAQYLQDLIKDFGDKDFILPEHLSGEEKLNYFVNLLKEKRRIKAISMRDPPPPAGAHDKTFTYYSKSILDGTGAKHQVRLRTYIRTLEPQKMQIDVPILGYLDGNIIQITKNKPGIYELKIAKNVSPDGLELSEVISLEHLSLKELKLKLGRNLNFYAYPHAKKLKLEIKTRPHDEVKTQEFEKLMGKNFVQKLSVDVDLQDIDLLFSTNKNKRFSIERLELLKEKVLQDSNNARARTNAVFDLLNFAATEDQNFFISRGATEYRRFAFEVEIPDEIANRKVRVQTTFDYDMGVRDTYDQNGKFLTPLQAVNQNSKMMPKDELEELHIELKVPKVLIEAAANNEGSQELLKLLEIFNHYQVTNKGKFNHILKQREMDE